MREGFLRFERSNPSPMLPSKLDSSTIITRTASSPSLKAEPCNDQGPSGVSHNMAQLRVREAAALASPASIVITT